MNNDDDDDDDGYLRGVSFGQNIRKLDKECHCIVELNIRLSR